MCALSLVVVDAERGRAAEERVVHEDIGGEVVSVRVPEATRPHAHALAALLADHHLHHDLQRLRVSASSLSLNCKSSDQVNGLLRYINVQV